MYIKIKMSSHKMWAMPLSTENQSSHHYDCILALSCCMTASHRRLPGAGRGAAISIIKFNWSSWPRCPSLSRLQRRPRYCPGCRPDTDMSAMFDVVWVAEYDWQYSEKVTAFYSYYRNPLYTGCCKTSGQLWKSLCDSFLGVFFLFFCSFDCKIWVISHFQLWYSLGIGIKKQQKMNQSANLS